MRLPCLLLLATLVPLAAAQSAEWLEPRAAYSARRIMDAGGMEMAGRVYHDHGKERWEVALGRETVAGEETTKYRSEGQSPTGPFTMLFWVTDDGITLRMEGQTAEGSFRMRLEELSRGPQAASLFELPPGVQVMPIDPAAMRQMAPPQ